MSDNKDYKTFVLWDTPYRTLIPQKYLDRKPWTPVDTTKVYSFIPGTIRKLHVKEGQTFKKGEPILTLESMKMMNLVRALRDGIVKKIHVAIDERIPKNHLMVEFE